MESTDLFSHPYKPEVLPSKEDAAEAVQLPTFSDRQD
jgi:hypothetical protein